MTFMTESLYFPTSLHPTSVSLIKILWQLYIANFTVDSAKELLDSKVLSYLIPTQYLKTWIYPQSNLWHVSAEMKGCIIVYWVKPFPHLSVNRVLKMLFKF